MHDMYRLRPWIAIAALVGLALVLLFCCTGCTSGVGGYADSTHVNAPGVITYLLQEDSVAATPPTVVRVVTPATQPHEQPTVQAVVVPGHAAKPGRKLTITANQPENPQTPATVEATPAGDVRASTGASRKQLVIVPPTVAPVAALWAGIGIILIGGVLWGIKAGGSLNPVLVTIGSFIPAKFPHIIMAIGGLVLSMYWFWDYRLWILLSIIGVMAAALVLYAKDAGWFQKLVSPENILDRVKKGDVGAAATLVYAKTGGDKVAAKATETQVAAINKTEQSP